MLQVLFKRFMFTYIKSVFILHSSKCITCPCHPATSFSQYLAGIWSTPPDRAGTAHDLGPGVIIHLKDPFTSKLKLNGSQSLLQQSNPTTWYCHPCTSWLGWCLRLLSFTPLSLLMNCSILLSLLAHKQNKWVVRVCSWQLMMWHMECLGVPYIKTKRRRWLEWENTLLTEPWSARGSSTLLRLLFISSSSKSQ